MKVEFINLLPVPYRRRQMLQMRIKQWVCIWSIGALLISGYAWSQFQTFNRSQHDLTIRRTQYGPIEQLETDTRALENKIQELQQREQLALQIANDRPLIQLVGLVSDVARRTGGVVIHKFNVTTAAAPEDPQRRRLSMQGLGVSSEVISSFLKGLRDSKMFVQVNLNSTENSAENQQLRKYIIEGQF